MNKSEWRELTNQEICRLIGVNNYDLNEEPEPYKENLVLVRYDGGKGEQGILGGNVGNNNKFADYKFEDGKLYVKENCEIE
jgi:hypothetical protein